MSHGAPFISLRNVRKDILAGFASDTETDKALPDVIAGPARPTFRHRMHSSETRGLANKHQGTQEGFGLPPRCKVEAHDRAETAHLTPGNLMTWMGRQAWIVHCGDIATRGEELRQTCR